MIGPKFYAVKSGISVNVRVSARFSRVFSAVDGASGDLFPQSFVAMAVGGGVGMIER